MLLWWQKSSCQLMEAGEMTRLRATRPSLMPPTPGAQGSALTACLILGSIGCDEEV